MVSIIIPGKIKEELLNILDSYGINKDYIYSRNNEETTFEAKCLEVKNKYLHNEKGKT